MEVHQLRILRELGERGSVAAVARALHVTPSAVSQQLAALQRSSRAPLTERRGRRLALTDAGRRLAAAAVEVIGALDRAAHAVDGYLDDPTQPVTVAAFHSAALAYFAPLIGHLQCTGGPPVHCADADVAQSDFPALVADYDLVLAHRLDSSPPWPTDRLTVVPLVHEPLYIALPDASPLADSPRLTAADVATQPWISVHDGFPVQGTLAAIAAAAGRPLDITHRINEFTVAASVVASGAALALLPGYTTIPNPRVVLRPLDDVPAGRHIDVLTRPETPSRASVQVVLQALHAITERLRDRPNPAQ
jgi:DNA-binding transcriptional LysR family regulator